MILALVKPTIVLWVFFSLGWSYGGIPMSRGWFSTYVYETMAECETSAKQLREERPHYWIICLPATHEPDGPKGKILSRKRMEVIWPADQKVKSATLLSQ